MDKIPLVLWSGGLDSTYIVWDHLSKDEPIDTLYVKLNNKEKSERETKSRLLIKNLLNQYSISIRNSYEIEMPVLGVSHNVTFTQPLLWLMSITLILDPDIHSHVELGYIRGDDYWHVKDYVEKSCYYLDLTCHIKHGLSIKYPLEWMTKVT